jgi:hypothetical protein
MLNINHKMNAETAKPKKFRLNLALSPGSAQKLEELAREEFRSVTNMIQVLTEREWQRRETGTRPGCPQTAGAQEVVK